MNDQTLDSLQRKSVDEAKGMAAGAKDVVNDVMADAKQKVSAARDTMQDTYQAAKASASEMQAAAVEKGTAAAEATARYVKENPWVAVGAAAAIGIAIGLLTRRR